MMKKRHTAVQHNRGRGHPSSEQNEQYEPKVASGDHTNQRQNEHPTHTRQKKITRVIRGVVLDLT